MRIGIDVRKIRDTGIGRYIENLVANLLKVDRRHEYVLFFHPEDMALYDYPADRVAKVEEPVGKYSAAEHWALPKKVKAYDVDLFHAPHYVLPLFLKCPSLVTVHDVIHLLDPSFGPLAKAYARGMLRSAISRAEMVLTVSARTKIDLISLLDTPPSKIRVIPNGGGSDFHAPSNEQLKRTMKAFGLEPGYFLFVGSGRRHKNLAAVAGALGGMRPDTRFVIVGQVKPEARAPFRTFGDRVVFLDDIKKDDIMALYAGAEALLFPSFHEGFGLPPLEAMACKTPVVASNASSIPEVVADAAVLVDPRNTAAMAKALERIRGDAAFRDDLIARGTARVRVFSWEKTARMTLECYEVVA